MKLIAIEMGDRVGQGRACANLGEIYTYRELSTMKKLDRVSQAGLRYCCFWEETNLGRPLVWQSWQCISLPWQF